MDTQSPNEEKSSGCLAPVLYWGAFFAISGISKLIAEDDENLAKSVFIIGIITWLLSPLLFALIGKSLKETKDNVASFIYLVVLIVIGLFVLGVISMILPSSCSRHNSPASDDIYYRR